MELKLLSLAEGYVKMAPLSRCLNVMRSGLISMLPFPLIWANCCSIISLSIARDASNRSRASFPVAAVSSICSDSDALLFVSVSERYGWIWLWWFGWCRLLLLLLLLTIWLSFIELSLHLLSLPKPNELFSDVWEFEVDAMPLLLILDGELLLLSDP